MKFFSYAIFTILLGLAINSCTGPDGADGIDGADGVNGADGVDGNANVQTYVFTNPEYSGSSMPLYLSAITQEVLDNDVILSYIKLSSNQIYYAVPGATGENIFRVFEFVGEVIIKVVDFDGNSDPTPPNLDKVILIIIKSSNTTTINGNGKSVSPQQAVYNELEKAGIDINNYFAVCDYYNINS